MVILLLDNGLIYHRVHLPDLEICFEKTNGEV
jgi:hypothetical protein